MLSADVRLRLEFIADRIANQGEVSLHEMAWIQKWADHNRHAAEILRRARREAIQGKSESGSLDEFMNAMDLGDPDPSNHLTGPQDLDTLVDWFKRRPDEGRPD
jgi:hypothetical protein